MRYFIVALPGPFHITILPYINRNANNFVQNDNACMTQPPDMVGIGAAWDASHYVVEFWK